MILDEAAYFEQFIGDTDDDYFNYMSAEHDTDDDWHEIPICKFCHGTGQDWDLTPCIKCDGEGYMYWLA